MAIGSGLSAQLGVIAETAWGTPLVVNKFFEFESSDLQEEPSWVEGSGLRAGKVYKRIGRTQQTRKTVNGGIVLEHAHKGGFGLWWKHALGSGITVPTVIGATTAFKQHHFPLSKQGLGLTIQLGKTEPGGTVQPHTYEGCKVTAWEFTLEDGGKAMLKLTLDGQQELTATALAAATYPTGLETFTSLDAGFFQLGGTVGVTANELTWATGTAPTGIVKGFTLRGENPMATERHGLGNSGLKAEQIENGIPTITGTLQAEYTRADYYNTFKAGTSTSLQLRLERGLAGTGEPFELQFTLPAIKLKSVPTPIEGPDIISSSIEFEAYEDDSLAALTGVNAGASNALEVRLVSTDTTLAG